MIAHDERRHGREITELDVGQLDVPTHLAVFGAETDQVGIGRGEVKPIFVHAQAAMADVVAFGGALVMPDLAAEAGVDGPDIVWRGEVENAVHFEWRGLEHSSMRAKYPGKRERADVSGVDLVEGAEAGTGIITVVGGPGIGGRPEQGCGIKALGCGEWGTHG